MRRNFFICLLLAGVTLAVYWPARNYDLIYFDDPLFVTESAEINSGVNGHSLVWAFTTVLAANWHPVTNLTFLLTHQFLGVNPGAEHLVNALFHTANVMLLFFLLRKISGATWRSAFVAALFAWHPLRVESVAWIAERKDVLCGFFFLLALVFYARFTQAISRSDQRIPVFDPRGWTPDYWLALLFFALGLMSKAMVVTLPFVMLLLDFWPLKRMANGESRIANLRRLALEKIPFFALAFLFSALTYSLQQDGAIMSFERAGWDVRSGNIVASYWRYLGKMFWPAELAIQYPFPVNGRAYLALWPGWEIFAGAAALLLVSILCVRQLSRRPYLAVGWFWFLGTLLPVIGLVQVGGQGMADRYTYIPLIGAAMAVVWLVAETFNPGRWRKILIAAAVLSLGVCAVLTRKQLDFWRDTVSLFDHAIEVTGDNHLAQMVLANGYEHQGRWRAAMMHDRIAIAIVPSDPDGYLDLARLLLKQQEWNAAREAYGAALMIDPNNTTAHLGLANVLPHLGRQAEAVHEFETILQSDPYSLEALNNLAWIFAASAESDLRDGPRAVRYAECACELTHYRKTIFIGTLAAAYAEAGRFVDAIAAAQKACANAEKLNEPDLLRKNRELLALYQSHQPYHDPAAASEKLVPAAK